jgi:signal transduction histidine kinase
LRLQPVFLGDPVTETVRLLKRTLTPQVEVESSVPLDLWPVLADSGQLGQVLLNLGLNSRDAMPGGGRLRVEAANVVVDEAYARTRPEARPGEFARLTVTDTGLGIPDDVRQHIFEPFFTTKEFGKGTGLGLAVVYGIVKQHEGWIECTSEPARGARFDVYLPRFTGESRLWAMVSK